MIADCIIIIGVREGTRHGVKEAEMLRNTKLIKKNNSREEKSLRKSKPGSKFCVDFPKVE